MDKFQKGHFSITRLAHISSVVNLRLMHFLFTKTRFLWISCLKNTRSCYQNNFYWVMFSKITLISTFFYKIDMIVFLEKNNLFTKFRVLLSEGKRLNRNMNSFFMDWVFVLWLIIEREREKREREKREREREVSTWHVIWLFFVTYVVKVEILD